MDMTLKGMKMKPNDNRNPDGIPELNNCKYCNGDALPYKKPGKSEYYIKCRVCLLCSPISSTLDEALEYWNAPPFQSKVVEHWNTNKGPKNE